MRYYKIHKVNYLQCLYRSLQITNFILNEFVFSFYLPLILIFVNFIECNTASYLKTASNNIMISYLKLDGNNNIFIITLLYYYTTISSLVGR